MAKNAPEAVEITTRLQGDLREDTSLADRVVEGIREIHLRKGLEYYLELGQFLIDEMFGGDSGAFRERGTKHATFRSLEERHDLPVSYVTLHQAVRVREQFDSLPEDARNELTYSHHRALLPVRTDAVRSRLAATAVEEGWTVAHLKQQVTLEEASVRLGEKRGRKPLPKFEKTLNLIGKVLRSDDAFADLERIDDLDDARVAELHDIVLSLQDKAQEIQDRIGARGST